MKILISIFDCGLQLDVVMILPHGGPFVFVEGELVSDFCSVVFRVRYYEKAESAAETRIGLSYIGAHKTNTFVKTVSSICNKIIADAKESCRDVTAASMKPGLEDDMQAALTNGNSVEFSDAIKTARSFAGKFESASAEQPHWEMLICYFHVVGQNHLSILCRLEKTCWSVLSL